MGFNCLKARTTSRRQFAFNQSSQKLLILRTSKPRNFKLSTPPKIAVGTHFHVQHSTKTTLVFLPPDGKASYSLLPNSASFLSGATVPPENTYSCILKITGQV